MAYSIEPLAAELPFGRIVRGLAGAHIADPAVRAELLRTWYEAGVLVFRDGEINEEFHLELSRVFGALEIHKTKEYLDKRRPELVTLTTAGATVIDVDGELGEFQAWHKDLVYTDRINRGGILRALKPTEKGGITGFVDLVDAYDRLPDAVKARIADLRAVYQISTQDECPHSTRSAVRMLQLSPQLQALVERRERDFPMVSHPLIFSLPETGQTVLNFSAFHIRYIEGLSAADSDALVKELSDHIIDSPAYHHRWSTDEMVLWDNWRITHMVSVIPLDVERIMQRTTIAGDYGLGRRVAS